MAGGEFVMVLAVLAGAIAGIMVGWVSSVAWLHRDETGQNAWRNVRFVRRHDRAREAIALARENTDGFDVDRALKWARRAVRLDRRNPEAHAVLGSCRHALEHEGQAIRHHRRAEDLVTDLAMGLGREKGAWRFQNAVDAVHACMRLRSEASGEEAQALWDEAHAWAALAYRLNPEAAGEEFSFSPWLANLTEGGEAWLQP